MALGMVYMRAVELAGGLPVVLPPLAPERVAPLRRAARRASACRAGRTSRRRATAPSRTPSWGRPSRAWTSSRWRSCARPTRSGCRSSASAAALQALNVARGGTLHQHLPDVTDGSDRAPPDRAGPRRDARRADRAGLAAGGHPRRGRDARELVPPPGDRAARRRAECRRPGRPTARSRRVEGDGRARSSSACSGTRRGSSAGAEHLALFETLVDAAGRARSAARPRSRRCAASPARSGAHGAPDRRGARADAGGARAARPGRRAGCGSTGGVGLAHRRLAIIDLSARGAQPMVDDGARPRGRVQRLHLQPPRAARGAGARRARVRLATRHRGARSRAGPTWGEGCSTGSPGMFAFALAERDSGRLVLARDRLGVKPLYLVRRAGRGAALRLDAAGAVAGGGVDTAVDPVALHHYLSLHAIVPAPRTILRGVRKLPPATVLVVEPGRRAGASGAGGTRRSRATRRAPAGARPTGRARCSTRCAPRSTGAWWPTSPSACCSPAGSTRR